MRRAMGLSGRDLWTLRLVVVVGVAVLSPSLGVGDPLPDAASITSAGLVAIKPEDITACDPKWLSSLPGGLIRSLLDPQTRAILPRHIAALRVDQVEDLLPAQIALFRVEQLKAFTDEHLAHLTHEQIGAFTTDLIKSLPAAKLARISPAALTGLRLDAIKALSKEQVLALSQQQYAALSEEQRSALPEEARSERRFRLNRFAMRPGIRLVGDAYSQLVDAAGNSASGAFGGGVQVETLKAKVSVLVRKGTQPNTLRTRQEFGNALLSPQTESFYFGADLGWWPDRLEKKGILYGVQATLDVAQANWEVELAPADSAAGLAAVKFGADTRSVAATVAASGLYIASEGENYVEIRAWLGGGARGRSFDGDVDTRLNEVRAANPRAIQEGGFRDLTLGRDRTFFSAEFGVSIRVNSIVISASLPYVSGNAAGLSGFRFIPALSLRAGAELVRFDDLDHAMPRAPE